MAWLHLFRLWRQRVYREMLTTAEAAVILQVSRRRIHELIRLGTIKAEKFGRDWQVDQESVRLYSESPRKPGRKTRSNVATNVAESNTTSTTPQHNAE